MKKIISLAAALSVLVMLFATMPMGAFAAGKGDVNADGKVNTADVRTILVMVANEIAPTEKQLYWGDYDVNGQMDTSDARVLLGVTVESLSTEAINYADPTDTDWWGDRSIAVLGDSISFGVGASDPIPENSYIGIVKKAVAAANGGNMNYGFTSAYATSWQPNNRADEIHLWPERTSTDGTTDWVCDGDEDGNRLCSVAMTATKPWAVLTYELREEYKGDYEYFCVYYQAKQNAGSFAIADGNGGEVADINGSKQYILASDNTTADTNETRRSAFYRLSDCPDGKIRICAGSNTGTDTPISITGIGYYKDITTDTVTFNSYTRGGISLVNMSDTVLSQAASSETMILALGFNDVQFNTSRVVNGEFTERINYLIAECNKNGTNVIVNDYVWYNPALYESYGWDADQLADFEGVRDFAKSELKRLAAETHGIYIDQQTAIGSDTILADLNSEGADMIHPTSAGHALMAQNVIEALGLD